MTDQPSTQEDSDPDGRNVPPFASLFKQTSTQERERALNKMRAARFDAVALAKQHGDSLTPEQVDLIVWHGSQDVEGPRIDVEAGAGVEPNTARGSDTTAPPASTTQERCPTCGGPRHQRRVVTVLTSNPPQYVRCASSWHDAFTTQARPGEEVGRGGISAKEQQAKLQPSTTQEAEKALETIAKALKQLPREILREPFPENPAIDEMKAIRSYTQVEAEDALRSLRTQSLKDRERIEELEQELDLTKQEASIWRKMVAKDADVMREAAQALNTPDTQA